MLSISLRGISASQASCSSRCFGSGRNIRQPWMEPSALMRIIVFINSCCVQVEFSVKEQTRIPTFSQRLIAPRSYARSSARSPTRRIARQGTTPLLLSSSVRTIRPLVIAAATGAPFNISAISASPQFSCDCVNHGAKAGKTIVQNCLALFSLKLCFAVFG